MTNWISRMFTGGSTQPPAPEVIAVELRTLSPEAASALKDRIDSMPAAELARELQKSGYTVVERDGHHLVSHAKLGKYERHAYDSGDLATILRKEMAESAKAL